MTSSLASGNLGPVRTWERTIIIDNADGGLEHSGWLSVEQIAQLIGALTVTPGPVRDDADKLIVDLGPVQLDIRDTWIRVMRGGADYVLPFTRPQRARLLADLHLMLVQA